MPGFLFENITMTCNSIVFANSGVDGSGYSKASIVLHAKEDLDPANTGSPIRFIEQGLSFGGRTLRLGDKIEINHDNCTNYPASLPAFEGYIVSISPTSQDMNSAVGIELRDEKWKWAEVSLPNMTLNQGQKPMSNKGGNPFAGGSAASKEMSAREVLDFVLKYVKNFVRNTTLDYDILPDKEIGEVAVNGNAYSFVLGLLQRFYGSAYQLYSPGVGKIEIVKVETNRSNLAQFKVDKENLISNSMVLASGFEENLDGIICVGANKQYYVGDGLYDNELVPDWDWWNDARIIIIDKRTMTPATYRSADGSVKLVNPFDFAVNIEDAANPYFMAPATEPSAKRLVFREVFNRYPSYWEYNRAMMNPISEASKVIDSSNGDVYQTALFVSKYCYGTTYAFDCLLRATGLTDPIHSGRFRRFRLKDNLRRHCVMEVNGGQFVKTSFSDEEIFPSPTGRVKPGDPMDLNRGALNNRIDVHDPISFDRYKVIDEDMYYGYKTIILDSFLNNASHEIKVMREKPGVFLNGLNTRDQLGEFYQPVPDEEDPTKYKEAPSSGPIVVRFDLIAGKKVQGYSSVFAERVRVSDFSIVSGNKILFKEPQIFTSDVVDEKFIKNTREAQEAIEREELTAFYDPVVYDSMGRPTEKRWYQMMRAGLVSSQYPAVRKVKHPVRDQDPVTKDGRKIQDPIFKFSEATYPVAIPRMEIFCFVQYVDLPEREKATLLADIGNSAYWRDIKTTYIFPETLVNLLDKKVSVEYRDDIVMQVGGMFEYTGDRQEDAAKYEVIAFYENTGINIAEDFDTADKSLVGYGQKKNVFAFQLRNDKEKFYRDVELKVLNMVPKGEAQYFNRPDLMPEKNGANKFISSVTHNLANGWTVDVGYGGQMPTTRKLYEESKRLNAGIFTVMDQTAMRRMNGFLITPAQERKTP